MLDVYLLYHFKIPRTVFDLDSFSSIFGGKSPSVQVMCFITSSLVAGAGEHHQYQSMLKLVKNVTRLGCNKLSVGTLICA